ncbi:MAG: hypothetical protein ACRD2D_13380 [Terriglobales bacterium]
MATTDAGGLAMLDWLARRRALILELQQALQEGFRAVAAFQGAVYLDCVQRQDEICQRIRQHDRGMPAPSADREAMVAAAAELKQMNLELKQLAEVQAALVEHGSRSVRCFQRVWAMGEPAYGLPEAETKPPASVPNSAPHPGTPRREVH